MIEKNVKIIVNGILEDRSYYDFRGRQEMFYIDDEKLVLENILKDFRNKNIKITIEILEE